MAPDIVLSAIILIGKILIAAIGLVCVVVAVWFAWVASPRC
jgi:hypothetical protein